MIETKMRPDNVLEVERDGVFLASFIFDKDTSKGALNGTLHTPEMRFDGRAIRFVGATPQSIMDNLADILDKYEL